MKAPGPVATLPILCYNVPYHQRSISYTECLLLSLLFTSQFLARDFPQTSYTEHIARWTLFFSLLSTLASKNIDTGIKVAKLGFSKQIP